MEKTWSDLSGAKCYFSHGSTDSRGVAVLITPNSGVKVEKVTRDEDGRYIMLEVNHNGTQLLILNVYAPTKDKVSAQVRFFQQLNTLLEDHIDKHLVIAGDFNTCLNPTLDKKGGTTESDTEAKMKLKSLLDYLDLVDIWRIRNPDRQKFSWRRRTRGGLVQSRLDYFFVSSSIADVITSTDIGHGICSDHSLLSLAISKSDGARGRGLWKFNSSLLMHNDFVDSVKEYIGLVKDEYRETTDKGLLWDLIKCKLRGFITSYAIRKRKADKEAEFELLKKIELLEQVVASADEKGLDELEACKEEYDQCQKDKAQGAIIRSKAKWAEYGEKNSKFFLQLEKRNHDIKHIKSLTTETGTITDPHEILEEERLYYSELYCEKKDRKNTIESCVFTENKNITTVSSDISKKCDVPLDLDECHKALMSMANNKSPGSDGFSVEFYKCFWEEIKDMVLESFQYAFNTGKLSIDQRRGVISLIPKKDKDVRLLQNWRPISLLNTDYKILTKVLASRLQFALKDIISPDQTGYIKGRNIGENIRLMDDIIHVSTQNNMKGYIVLLDFQKAFDSVSISFLKKTLETFNFGPYFRQWIEVIYNGVSSCVTNNGHISDFFTVTRGIRQGCPISSLLFIMVVELLSSYIKKCPDIKGLTIGNDTFIITQLADDTTLFLQDEKSIANLLCVMDRFFECSGLRLNKQKSEVFLLGNCGQGNNVPNQISGLKCITGAFRALGIYFSKDKEEVIEKNFKTRLANCQVALNIWSQHNLSLKGKVTVLKSLIIPNLLFACSNLFVPESFISDVNVMFFKFLWNNKPPKIRQETIIADLEEGGLKMPHFPTVVKAAKVMWVKRLLEENPGNWKLIALRLANVTRFDLCCKNDVSFIKTLSPFYEQVLDAWFKFYSTEPKSIDELKHEVLWNNKFILIDQKPVLYKKWQKNGVTHVQDLFQSGGKLLTHEELKNKYNIKVNILEYISLVKALPRKWLKAIRTSTISSNVKPWVITQESTKKLCTKRVYWSLLENIVKEPVAVSQWISLFPFLHDNDFAEIFKLSYLTMETRLQSFQYKLLNRILPCNYKLSIWGLSSTSCCNVCNNVDTQEHHLFYCNETRAFWQFIEKWLQDLYQVYIPLKITDVMFGVPYKKTQDEMMYVLNYIIIHGKWHIYTCKKNCQKITLSRFLKYLKHALLIEQQMSINKNNLDVFHKRWSFIVEKL